jgi:hypothetical protein
MLVISLHARFHSPGRSGSFIFPINPEVKGTSVRLSFSYFMLNKITFLTRAEFLFPPRVSSGPEIMCTCCRLRLTSLHVFHVGNTDCRKYKGVVFGCPSLLQ